MSKTHEVIKDVELGRPMQNGGYVLRLLLQNGDFQDVYLHALSGINKDGEKTYQVEVDAP